MALPQALEVYEYGTQPALARRLGLFDATMIVMGGIIGSGIFMNPSVVARQVNTPFLILGVWVLGGLVALNRRFHLGRTGCACDQRLADSMLTCVTLIIRSSRFYMVGDCSW